MYLYYTSIAGNEVEQPKPELSLGGYKSSSRVSNGVLNNMFSDITPMTISNFNQNRYIGLVLMNESGLIANNLNIWFDYPEDKIANFRIGAVTMVSDGENLYMEHVPTVNSKPLYPDFHEADGELNKVSIGTLPVNGRIGIWIEMEIDIDAAKSQLEGVYGPVPGDDYRFQEIIREKLEDVGLVFSWD